MIPRAPTLTDVVAVTLDPAVDRTPAQRVHRVKRGDTLYSLARLYRTTVAAIKDWNRLRSNLIRVGQRLTIFEGPPTIATN